MREQKLQDAHIVEVERPPQCTLSMGTGLQQQARALNTFERVIQRFAIIRVSTSAEQQLGQFGVMILPSGTIERGKQVLLRRLRNRGRRPPAACRLIRVSAVLQQIARRLVQVLAIIWQAQQTRMRYGNQGRQPKRTTCAIDPLRVALGLLPKCTNIANRTSQIRVVSDYVGRLRQHPSGKRRLSAIQITDKFAGVDQRKPV